MRFNFKSLKNHQLFHNRHKKGEECKLKILPLNNCDHNSQVKIISLRDDVQRSLQHLMRLMRTSSGFLKLDRHDIDSVSLTSDEERQYAFLWSAYLGRLDLLHQFHTEGANLQYVHPLENYNALHLAALSGSPEFVQWLLGKDCPITRTSDGLTPLHFAAFAGSMQICRELIKCKCPVDATALNAAVCSGSDECVQFLLHEGCPVNGYDDGGYSPLHTATGIGALEILKVLLNSKLVEPNERTRLEKYTALHIAAECGNAECMRALLENGADANANCDKGTALHLATKLSYVDCVEILLEYGAQVNIRDAEGRTPLHMALSKSPWSMQIIRTLVERGRADVNAADNSGFTALHVAAVQNFEKGVDYLIENGANVAATSKGGITALNFIARRIPHSLKRIPKRFSEFVSHKEQTLKLNFRDMLHYSTIGESEFLYILQNEGQAHYLLHPLCRAFLHLKWQKVRRLILLRVVLSAVAAILLSYYVLVSVSKDCADGIRYQRLSPVCGNLTMEECEKNDLFPLRDSWKKELRDRCPNGVLEECSIVKSWHNDSQHCNNSIFGALTLRNPSIGDFTWCLILSHQGFNVMRIIFSLPAYKTISYSFNYVNVVEILNMLNVLTLWFLWVNEAWRKVHTSIGAITVLSSWSYVTLTFSQLPFFGMHIAMFLQVLKHLLKTICAFSCLLAGFAFTFCVLKEKTFKDPVTGLVRTLAMMTGELNASEMIKKIEGTAKMIEKEGATDQSYLEYTTVFVVFLFIILVMIVLMNLTLGLTVSDVEGLHATAELYEVTKMSQLIFFIEKSCFRGFFNSHKNTRITKMLRRCLYVFPDPYVVAIALQPANPRERRMPKEIMDAAVKAANERTTARNRKTIDDRISGLELQLATLQATIQILNENLERKTVDDRISGLEIQLATLQATIQILNENLEKRENKEKVKM